MSDSDSEEFDFSSGSSDEGSPFAAKKNVASKKVPVNNNSRKRKNEDDDDDDVENDDFENIARSSKKAKALTPAKSKLQAPKKPESANRNKAAPQIDQQQNPPTSSSSSSSSSSSFEVGLVASVTSAVDITRGPNITTESAAKKLIMQYMRQQNRPYSSIQVHDNLHKRIPKATVERCLGVLSEEGGGLRCKEYGKAKIYFVDQSTFPTSFSPAELDALDKANDVLTRNLSAVQAEERSLRSELSSLTGEPTDAALDQVIGETRTRTNEKQQRADFLGTTKLDPNALVNAVKGHNHFRNIWRARKEICQDAVDMISEGMGKKTKDVMREMGIETDQDAGVSGLPPPIPEIRD